MASENRTKIHSLESQLLELEQRIGASDFVAVVRQLECLYNTKPRVGQSLRVKDDVLRFSQNVTLAFTGNALQGIDSAHKGSQDYRLLVNFFGLLGAQGPMPLHYTDYADQRDRHFSDPTFKAFLDIFNHRMISLFYRATVQFDPAVSFDRTGDNPYAEFLGALAGVLPSQAGDRDTMSDHAKKYYPGWFAATPRSPDGLAALIRDYFELPVAIKEWIGAWIALPTSSLNRLGASNTTVQLGKSMYLGRRVWSSRHKFRIQLGPLEWSNFHSFKPGSSRAKEMHDVVRNYMGDEWDWDIELTLAQSEVPSLRLNRQGSLGFDSWLRSGRGKRLATQSIVLDRRVIA